MANPSAIFTTGQTNDPRLFYQTGGSFSQISSPQQLQQLASQGLVQVGGQRQTLPQSYLSTLNPTQSPTPSPPATPAAPVPSATPSTTSTQPTRPLEVAPGVFSLSRLTDFYNNQTEKMRPIYEQAQQNLQSLNQQFTDLKAPNLRQEKDALFAQQVAPIDTKIAEKTAALTSYDDALRGIEDAVRAEVGGRASEAVIRAEIARRARPLELQRQTALQEIQGLESQRNRVVQNISSSLDLGIADYETQVNRINTQRQLANDAVNSFNSLVEKGAAATDKERDDFRSIVSTLIQSTPDVLQSLTSDEYTQLERGFLSQSVLNKITNTIKEKELAQKAEIEAEKLKQRQAEAAQNSTRVIGNAKTGFFEYDEVTRELKPLRPSGPTSRVGGVQTGGGSGSSGGTGNKGVNLSPKAQAIIDGVLRLEDLTPTDRGNIAAELIKAGYKSGPKLSSSQQNEVADANTTIGLIDEVFKYNADGNLEGIGSLGRGSLGQISTKVFGTGSEEAKAVRSLIGNIRATITKLRAGTSFTAGEKALLDTYVPDINESPQSVLSKLNGLRSFLAQRNSNLVNAAADRGVKPTSTQQPSSKPISTFNFKVK